jgi:ATP adenylyltransferase
MKKLWAPWRMKYISGAAGKNQTGCIFCKKPKSKADHNNYILRRGQKAFVMMNIFPYNNGHLMIAPYRHVGDFTDLSDAELLEIMQLAQACQRAMNKVMKPQGYNLGFNLGRVAGAGIEDHLHLHLVPRWNGDTNFMPVLTDTKVVSEALEDSFKKMKKALDEYFMMREGMALRVKSIKRGTSYLSDVN